MSIYVPINHVFLNSISEKTSNEWMSLVGLV